MTFSSLSKSFSRLFPVCLVAMTAAWMLPASVAAQDFDELPVAEKYQMVEVDEDADNKRELTRLNRDARTARKADLKAVQALLSSGGNVDVPTTQEFLDGFVFPSMTMAENLTDAGRLRYDFDRNYLGTKFTGASRVPFIEKVVLPRLKTLVENDKISPAARVNAIVMISRLDDSPLIRTTKTPPRPSLAAFDSLISTWQGQNPDFVKAAAFSGILRHMEIDNVVSSPRIPADKKTQLMRAVTAAVDAILAEDPELKVDLNRWKVTKSVELMSKSRLAAETEAYFDRMSAMLAKDSKIPKWVKLEAVRGLTRLPMTGIAPAKIDSLIENSINYASQSLKEEAAGLERRVQDLVINNILWDNTDLEVTGTNYTDAPKAVGMMGGGKGSMGMGGGMMGGGGSMMGGGMMGGGDGDDQDGSSTKMGGGGMMGGGMMMGGGGKGMMMGEDAPDPIVELPNYELNLSRRRMKLVIRSVDQLLSLEPVQVSATQLHKEGLDKLSNRIQEFLNEDSSIGLVDLGKKKKGDSKRKDESYAMQLKAVCESMSFDLANAVSRMRGEEMKKAADAFAVPVEEAPAEPFGR